MSATSTVYAQPSPFPAPSLVQAVAQGRAAAQSKVKTAP